MSLPTVNKVTNLFLYGKDTTPTDLPDETLIRDAEAVLKRENKLTHENINAVEYMAGPGRFALGSTSVLVEQFFTHEGSISGVTLGQEYTKAEMAAFFGLSNANYSITFQQYSYDDGQGDYGERVYIWNSTAFKISDDARFIVDADGKRHIEHFAIIPRYDITSEEDSKENFDFATDDWGTEIANLGRSAGWPRGQVPDINRIAEADATAVAA